MPDARSARGRIAGLAVQGSLTEAAVASDHGASRGGRGPDPNALGRETKVQTWGFDTTLCVQNPSSRAQIPNSDPAVPGGPVLGRTADHLWGLQRTTSGAATGPVCKELWKNGRRRIRRLRRGRRRLGAVGELLVATAPSRCASSRGDGWSSRRDELEGGSTRRASQVTTGAGLPADATDHPSHRALDYPDPSRRTSTEPEPSSPADHDRYAFRSQPQGLAP